MRDRKPAFKIMTLAALLAASPASALAQCAMCKAAVAASAESARVAGSMNLAVLVLLVPPILLFCAFLVVLYRYRKAPDEGVAANCQREEDQVSGPHHEDEDEGSGVALRAGDLTHV